MSWITPSEHSKVDNLARGSVTPVEPPNAIMYGWVDVEEVGNSYVLSTKAIIEVVGIVVDNPQDWSVLGWARRGEYAVLLTTMRSHFISVYLI